MCYNTVKNIIQQFIFYFPQDTLALQYSACPRYCKLCRGAALRVVPDGEVKELRRRACLQLYVFSLQKTLNLEYVACLPCCILLCRVLHSRWNIEVKERACVFPSKDGRMRGENSANSTAVLLPSPSFIPVFMPAALLNLVAAYIHPSCVSQQL